MARALAGVVVLWAGVALADSWAPAPTTPQTHASANKKFRFVVAPGDGEARGRILARGKLLDAKGAELWSVAMVNRTVPLDVLVSDDGQFVATFDDYGHSGGPNAVVLYRSGRMVAHLGLDALVTRREARKLMHSASSIWWRASQQFDLTKRKLVLTLAVGGNRRPTEAPGPMITRSIDLDTGGVLGLPEGAAATAASLLAELETTPDRDQVLADLAADFPEDPAVLALWRKLAFDEKAPPRERSMGLRQLGKRLTPEDLAALTPLLADPKNPLAMHVLQLVVDRRDTRALPALLAACKQPFDGRSQYLAAALTLSNDGPEATALALEHGDAYLKGKVLAKLNGTEPAKARGLALAMLTDADVALRTTAERVLLQSLDPNDGARLLEAATELTRRALDPTSPVTQSPRLMLALGALAFDRNRLDEAASLYGSDKGPSASAQLAFVEAARGNAAACVAIAKKLSKLPAGTRVCAVGFRPPRRGGEWLCSDRGVENVVEELATLCGGPLKAKLGFELRGGIIDLAGTLENTTKTDLAPASFSIEMRWAHQGFEAERTRCSVKKPTLPKKAQVEVICQRVRLPSSVEGTQTWPLRADIELTVVFADGKQKPMRARTTAFLVR